MDKLMNAANESGGTSKLNSGEYVFYVIEHQTDFKEYTLRFIGESPTDKNVIVVKLDQFESEHIHTEQHAKYSEIKSTLQGLFEKKEPVYCIILNNLICARNFNTSETHAEKVMMVTPELEVITEDMKSYKLPELSSTNEVGSGTWFMNKYMNKPEGTNSLNAIIFNDTLIDIVWYRTKEYKMNLLDILEDAVESKGWTSAGLASHICTCKEPK